MVVGAEKVSDKTKVYLKKKVMRAYCKTARRIKCLDGVRRCKKQQDMIKTSAPRTHRLR